MAANEVAMAARAPPPLPFPFPAVSSATSRAASAVELAACTSTPGSFRASQSRHWALAWGIDTTAVTSARRVPGRAQRCMSIGSTTSRWMTRSSDASKASVSSVTLTEPSMAFSMGTTPRSARPWSTSVMTSEISRTGTRSPAARSGWDSRASSVNVPGGPRNATRGRGGWAGGDIAGHPM